MAAPGQRGDQRRRHERRLIQLWGTGSCRSAPPRPADPQISIGGLMRSSLPSDDTGFTRRIWPYRIRTFSKSAAPGSGQIRAQTALRNAQSCVIQIAIIA